MASKQLTIRQNLETDHFLQKVVQTNRDADPEAFQAACTRAVMTNAKLAGCSQKSFFRSVMDLVRWNLLPDGRQAHLIPYGTECTLVIDYKGLVELAYRSGTISRIHADVVREGDAFVYDRGEIRQHVPWFLRRDSKPDEAGEIIAAYCDVRFKDGAEKCEILAKEEIEAIRTRSRAGNSGPWKTDWCEMAKKTAFRRVSKWLPLSAEVRTAFERDDDRLRDIPPATPQGAAHTPSAADFEQLLSGEQPEVQTEPEPATNADFD